MNYIVSKEERIKRNKGIIKDYEAKKLSLKDIAEKYNVSHSTVDKVISNANLPKDKRRGTKRDDYERFNYEYRRIDKGIQEIKLASGDIRYHVNSQKGTRRFKTLEEAENFVYSEETLEKDIELAQYPINAIEGIFGSEATNLFDDMNYVISHWEENFGLVCETLLDEKEREIVNLRFKEGYTLNSIGNVYGLTRERIRQLLYAIVRKIKWSSFACDYINRGASNAMLKKDIESLEKELVLRKQAIQDEINKIEAENPLSDEELMKIQMSKDSIDRYSLKLKTRTRNGLLRAGFKTVKDVVDYIERKGGYEGLLQIRAFGVDCVKDLKGMLKKTYGYVYGKKNNNNSAA